jgi:hypothetical protein
LHTFSHSKSGTLTVNKASLTVTADNKSKIYGASNPTFTASYSAFANGDTAADPGGALGFDTNATQQSSVGSHAITPKGLTSDNHAITFKDGTLTYGWLLGLQEWRKQGISGRHAGLRDSAHPEQPGGDLRHNAQRPARTTSRRPYPRGSPRSASTLSPILSSPLSAASL